jgi:hypothetical protein
MMSSGRRPIMIGAIALLAWYAVTVLFWAVPKLSDSVPAGFDRRPAANAPATEKLGPAVAYSQRVACNNLLSSAARPDAPLPVLPVQPEGANQLQYNRTPCTSVHSQARSLFVLNTIFVVAVFAAGGWLLARRRRAPIDSDVMPAALTPA